MWNEIISDALRGQEGQEGQEAKRVKEEEEGRGPLNRTKKFEEGKRRKRKEDNKESWYRQLERGSRLKEASWYNQIFNYVFFHHADK